MRKIKVPVDDVWEGLVCALLKLYFPASFRILGPDADYIYYEGVVYIPKTITSQNFYYNYYVLPNGMVDWQYWEFFYDQKDNKCCAPRELSQIPQNAGN